MTYQLHPLCTLFPRMDGAEFDALCADIKANGLRQRIVLHDGMVLDGGNRYRACQVAGVDPLFDEFDGDNIVSFVLSANLHRRHMSAGQQAAIVSSAQNWAKAQTRGGDRRSADQSATLHFDSAAARAAESGASLRTQKMADKVAKKDPELARKVAHGDVSLPKAHAQVSSPAKPKTEAEAVRQQAAEDAYGDTDPLQMLEEAHAELEKLTAVVNAAEADDLKAEAMKWRRAYDHACRQQSEEMDKAKAARDREARTMKQLRRCGKPLGVDDPDKIAPAVEAFVRQHNKVAA